jgi:hypothetical protein
MEKEGMKMAELLECLVCGYKTVRCGMTNHLKAQHPNEYADSVHGKPMKDGLNGLTKSLGQIKCKDLKTFIKTLNVKKA